MPTYRLPGPLCGFTCPSEVDDGLLTLWAHAPPGSLSLGPAPTHQVGLEIVSPPPWQPLSIDADGPTMPRIRVKVRLTGIFPDPTAATVFR